MTDWAGFVVVRYQLGEYNILFAGRVAAESRVRSIFCCEFKSSLPGSRIVENSSSKSVADDMF